MNETALLLAIVAGALGALGNLGSAALGFFAKRREIVVAEQANDRYWISRLERRVDELERKLVERGDRIDALETEVAALHQDNADLRKLMERHGITPPRPRLRAVPAAKLEGA